jgi:hypothetical protein
MSRYTLCGLVICFILGLGPIPAIVLAEGKAPPPNQQKNPAQKRAEKTKKKIEEWVNKKQEQQNNSSSSSSSSSGSTVDEVGIKWKTNKFDESSNLRQKEKKPLYIYFYFSEKEKFPPNYDKELLKYSEEKAVFANVFVEVNKKGEITDEKIGEFYKNNRLSKSGVAVILDKYGNLMEKLSISSPSSMILDAFERAEQKTEESKKDLSKRWDKVKKHKEKENKAEMIKELNQIIKNNNWRGYEVFVAAEKELNGLNEPLNLRLKEITRKYMAGDRNDESNRKETVAQLEDLRKESKDLPAETAIQAAIEKAKKGDSFEVEPAEAKEQKTEAKKENGSPPEADIDGSSGELLPVEEE